MNILNTVAEALRSHGIQHGILKTNHANTYNTGITDHKNVFCKIAPLHGNSSNLTNLNKELHFVIDNSYRLNTPIPLYPELITFDHDNHKRWMSVWQWEDMKAYVPETVEAGIVAEAMSQLRHIHNSPLVNIPALDADVLLYNIQYRINAAKSSDVSAHHIDLLNALVEKFYNPRDIDLSFPVLIHGDCHIGNFVKTEGGNKWIDYESVRIAPVEWDYAGMYINLSVLGNNHEAWLKGFSEHITMDDSKFWQAVAIKRISTAASFLLQNKTHRLFEERIESLVSLLE
jgi:hypothetical protein